MRAENYTFQLVKSIKIEKYEMDKYIKSYLVKFITYLLLNAHFYKKNNTFSDVFSILRKNIFNYTNYFEINYYLQLF